MLRFSKTLLTMGFLTLIVTIDPISSASAQDSAAPSTSSTSSTPVTPVKRPSNRAADIIVSVNKITSDQNGVAIQLAVQNDSKSRKYLMIFGSKDAILDSNSTGTLANVTGISRCPDASSDSDILRSCLQNNARDTNNYTYIEPGDFTTVIMYYHISTEGATSISFYFKSIVRTGPSEVDSPQDASVPKTISEPRTISINFPLIPLKGPS